MKRLVVIVVLLVAGKAIESQNLILNPSFEEVNEITTRWSGTCFDFNKRVKHWDSPTQGSPDILFVKVLGKMFPKRPKVELLGHLPRTGEFMVGIKTYGCKTNTLHCKEYVQIKLAEPLRPGEEYFFEYWVNPISTSVKVNAFGLALSMERSEELWEAGLIDIYPVSLNAEIIEGPANDWQRISGVFESDDNYEYVIIGNFSPDNSIGFKEEINGLDYGYYLLDDVLLRPVHPETPPELKPNEIIVLEKIFFEFDKANIQEVSKPQLNELVEYLKSNENYHLEIMGHTDSKGGEAYNLELSQERANSIKEFLVKNGIEDFRISPIGLGSTSPILANISEENRQINRRVEIRIIEK